MATFKPSSYNLAVANCVLHGSGDIVVEAVAGSGKTSQLVELATSGAFQTTDTLFLAFNKSIVEELTKRLGSSVQCQTLNSLGHRALGRFLNIRKFQLNTSKYRDYIFDVVKNIVNGDKIGETVGTIARIVSFSQSSLTNTDDDDAMLELLAHYGIDTPLALSDHDTFNIVRDALTWGEASARQGLISFDDQIWLPAKWNLKVGNSSWVLVDEAQDLSTAKLELALSARGLGGRMLFVGDSRQAIYGFAGADSASIANIITRTNATVLPLSICYRCPKAVIAYAQEIVSHIEAAPDAAEGAVNYIKDTQLLSVIKSGDLVLCRLTAPLIKLCLQLIAKGIPARVRGKELGKELVAFAKKALGQQPWSNFLGALDEYTDEMREALTKRKGDRAASAISALNDKADGVRELFNAFKPASFQDFSDRMYSIFSDDKAVIDLSTIHRAKGLQYPDVYLIKPTKLPLVWKNQKPWEALQEQNLDYVARTRASNSYNIVQDTEGAA